MRVMKKKITLVLLIVAFSAGISAFLAKKYIHFDDDKKISSSVVVPKSNAEKQTVAKDVGVEDEDTTLVSLVPLHDNEILISIVSQDFDGDGFDDQVNAIKTMDSPYISLVVGLYNQKTSAYERKAVLATEIIQFQTFSYTGMDLTGEHKTALVYQGVAENGDSILKAFFISNYNDRFSIRTIADLRGDGTIFIQQVDRYDSYERSRANGASFPIWVYTFDTEKVKSNDQLQIEYGWNPEERIYEMTKTIRVAGSRINAKELAKIQDGTVATFAAFLDGLWYMNESDGSGVRYLFFDYESKEIIFFKDDTEEVYKWSHSNIRRNGMYISSINQEIENLKRRIDLSLKTTEEIHVRIQDDVRMRISESTVWDGGYKKINQNLYKSKLKNKKINDDLVRELEKSNEWKTTEGASVKFMEGKYSVHGDNISDEGVYSPVRNGDGTLIQFRTGENDSKYFSGLYKIIRENSEDKENVLSLHPYKVYADGMMPLDQRSIVLTQVTEKED